MRVKNHRGYIRLLKEYLHGILLHYEQRRSARGFVFHQRPVQHDTWPDTIALPFLRFSGIIIPVASAEGVSVVQTTRSPGGSRVRSPIREHQGGREGLQGEWL
jgi:hypothetical protein